MDEPKTAAVALHLRDARPEEYAEVLAVTRAAYEQYASAMPADRWEWYLQNMAETITQPPIDGAPARIVAEADGIILGSVLLFPAGSTEGDEPHVRLLAVPPAVRGRGVGRALMDECLRRARVAGASTLTLHTTTMMEVAKAMYERMGFVRAPELDFHPEGADQVVTVMGYRYRL
jgi:predicted N-acetyltransferase YhbS